MDTHLLKCHERAITLELEAQPYYVKDTNSGVCNSNASDDVNTEHHIALENVLAKRDCIEVRACSLDVTSQEANGGGGGGCVVGVPKHVAQHQAIETFLRIVQAHSICADGGAGADAAGGTGDDCTVVEFGAGKGMLSLDLLRCGGIFFLQDRTAINTHTHRHTHTHTHKRTHTQVIPLLPLALC
jgi:hypothetical protein